MNATHPAPQVSASARRGGVPVWAILATILVLQAAVVLVGLRFLGR